MGEIADDLIHRAWDEDPDDFYGYPSSCRRSRHTPKKKKTDPKAFSEEVRAAEYPSKKTDPNLLPKYEEKTFDMSFFPTIPKKEPKKPEPSGWDSDPDEAPF